MSQKLPHRTNITPTLKVLVASLLVVFVLPASFQSSRSKVASSFSRFVNRVLKEGFDISFLLKKTTKLDTSYEGPSPEQANTLKQYAIRRSQQL
jgi:hypothetical protein